MVLFDGASAKDSFKREIVMDLIHNPDLKEHLKQTMREVCKEAIKEYIQEERQKRAKPLLRIVKQLCGIEK